MRSLLIGLIFLGGCVPSKPQTPNSRTKVFDKTCEAFTSRGADNGKAGLALTDEESPIAEKAIVKLKKEIPQGIDIIPVNISPGSSLSFEFQIQSYSLCDFSAKANRVNEEIYLSGYWPKNINPKGATILDWERQKNFETQHLQLLQKQLNLDLSNMVQVIDRKLCIYSKNNELLSASEYHFEYQENPYYALVVGEGEIVKSYSKNLHVKEGKSKVYVEDSPNSRSISYKTFPLSGLSDGGILCSQKFKTEMIPKAMKYPIAYSNTFSFMYNNPDPRFLETTLFTNATQHAAWIMGLGILKEWPGRQITIYGVLNPEHKELKNINTDPVYKPSSPPVIFMPHKLSSLDKLILDPDPISHEVGHHLIYQSVYSLGEVQVTLHEALADALVILRNKNPCFARLICNKESSVCISDQCMRNADNVYSYQDPKISSSKHFHSQFISGLIWSLSKDLNPTDTAKLVLKSIQYLDKAADYANFVHSMMLADKVLFKGEHVCKIQSKANERGMKDLLAENHIDCLNL